MAEKRWKEKTWVVSNSLFFSSLTCSAASSLAATSVEMAITTAKRTPNTRKALEPISPPHKLQPKQDKGLWMAEESRWTRIGWENPPSPLPIYSGKKHYILWQSRWWFVYSGTQLVMHTYKDNVRSLSTIKCLLKREKEGERESTINVVGCLCWFIQSLSFVGRALIFIPPMVKTTLKCNMKQVKKNNVGYWSCLSKIFNFHIE